MFRGDSPGQPRMCGAVEPGVAWSPLARYPILLERIVSEKLYNRRYYGFITLRGLEMGAEGPGMR